MKKIIKGISAASLSKYLFYLFSAYCFVFGITEYFFDDEIWGNPRSCWKGGFNNAEN